MAFVRVGSRRESSYRRLGRNADTDQLVEMMYRLGADLKASAQMRTFVNCVARRIVSE